MLRQIKILTGLELKNIFGLNVFRFSKDTKAKGKSRLLMVVWGLLIIMVAFYVGGLTYGLALLGMPETAPAYLITIASLIIFFFGIFKAGSMIFLKNGYDILCSMPVSQTAVVISRFMRMYVENLAFTLVVLIPGLAVYAWLRHPGALFYLFGIVVIALVPLAPVAAAVLLGAAVAAVSSRMKHKSLVEAGLTVLMVIAILAASSKLAAVEGEITQEMLQKLSATVFSMLEKLYPPAVWLGKAVVYYDVCNLLGCAALFFGIFAAMTAIVSVNFHSICRGLNSTTAKHNYSMGRLKENSKLLSLYKREAKRYFSSGVYVTNTIIGPIMGAIFAGAVLFVDMDAMLQEFAGQGFAISMNRVEAVIPFLAAGIFCMMTTTSCSVSMEGKNWWIVKSLPLRTKDILDAKILFNLSLMLPFYILSEIFLLLGLRPEIGEMLWMIVIPAVIILFSCVFGITVNLHFPVMNWENEASVVKQSASAMLGGMGGFLAAIACMVVIILTPGEITDLVNVGICAVLLGVTAVLYCRNNRTDLRRI